MNGDRDWMTEAACRGLDPETWFPEQGKDSRLRSKHPRTTMKAVTRLAQRICEDCPVKRECADYAIDTDSRYGIWGATTAPDRTRITGKR